MSFTGAAFPFEDFLEPRCRNAASPTTPFATAMRPRPRDPPGLDPVGWARASAKAKDMWSESRVRFQPYQYEAQFLVVQLHGVLRPLVVAERGRFRGFVSHNLPLLVKPRSKRERPDQENLRGTAVGNSFYCIVVARFLVDVDIGSAHGITMSALGEVWRKLESPSSQEGVVTLGTALAEPSLQCGAAASPSVAPCELRAHAKLAGRAPKVLFHGACFPSRGRPPYAAGRSIAALRAAREEASARAVPLD